MNVNAVNVAGFDQALADALVDLRRCRGFILATVNDDLDVSLAVCLPDAGDGEFSREVMMGTIRTLVIGVMST